MKKLEKTGLILLIVFYMIAGINHFRDPFSYIKIIPDYLPWPHTLNYLAGCFEISFSMLLVFEKTRRLAAFGIILMLIAFLPVHISMIANTPVYLSILKVTALIAWLRLLFVQPLLILWAYIYSNKGRQYL